jgi:hypothetical protein
MKNTRRQKRYKVDNTNISGTIIFASYLKINDISGGLEKLDSVISGKAALN